MKKILAIIGSPNNAKSNTATMTRDFLRSVEAFCQQVEWELISLGEQRIGFCQGCWGCMKTGKCVKENDDLPELRRKILDADLLVFGTPVYERHISAQMKALFDRTFMWIHLMALLGKPVLTAITTGGDGIRPTERYLEGVLAMMGGIVIGHLRGIGQQPGFFPDRKRCGELYRPLAQKVGEILSGKRHVTPGLLNVVCFEIMKHHTRRARRAGKEYKSNFTDYEYNYWKEKGWLNSSYRSAVRASASKSDHT